MSPDIGLSVCHIMSLDDENSATAVQPQDELIDKLTDELFEKTSDYVKAELEVTLDDYRLLEQMNITTSAKYSQLRGLSDQLKGSLQDLEKNYFRIIPYLEKIDSLEQKVTRLEELAYAIDSYTKKLEARYKLLQNSSLASGPLMTRQ